MELKLLGFLCRRRYAEIAMFSRDGGLEALNNKGCTKGRRPKPQAGAFLVLICASGASTRGVLVLEAKILMLKWGAAGLRVRFATIGADRIAPPKLLLNPGKYSNSR